MDFLGTSSWAQIQAPLGDECPIPEDTHSRVAESMGLPFDKWGSLRRRPQLCLPRVPLCVHYGNWLAAQSTVIRIHLMNVVDYNDTHSNLAEYEKRHTADAQIDAIRINGQALPNWMWLYFVDQGVTRKHFPEH